MGRPDLCKTSLCQRWAKGACPLEASECRFAHGRLDLRATPNFMHGLKGEGLTAEEQDEVNRAFGPPSEMRDQSQQQQQSFSGRDQHQGGHTNNGPNRSNSGPHGPPGGASQSGQREYWEQSTQEQCFPDSSYMGGGAPGAIGWGNRNQGNPGNPGGEAIDQMQQLLPRDWQGGWSPEYDDGGKGGGKGKMMGGKGPGMEMPMNQGMPGMSG